MRETLLILTVLVGLTASCGSRTTIEDTEDSGIGIGVDGECRPSSSLFSSAEAIGLARCRGSLPLGAVLASVSAWEEGADADGKSSSWTLRWIAAGTAYQQTVRGAGSVLALDVFVGTGKAGECKTGFENAASRTEVRRNGAMSTR